MAIQQGKGGASTQAPGGGISPQLPGPLPGNNVFGSLGGGLGASPTTPTPPPNGLGTAPTPAIPPPNGLGSPPAPVTPPPNGLPTTPTTPAPTTPPPVTPPATGGFQVSNYDTSDPNSPFYDPNRPDGYEGRPLAQIGSQFTPEMLANPQTRALLEGFQQQQIAGVQRQNEMRYQRALRMSQRNRIGEIGDPKQAAQNAALMAEYGLTSAPQRHSQQGGAGYGYDGRVAAGGSPYQNTAIPSGAPPLPQPYTTPPPPAPAGAAPGMTPVRSPYYNPFMDQVNDIRNGVSPHNRPGYVRK